MKRFAVILLLLSFVAAPATAQKVQAKKRPAGTAAKEKASQPVDSATKKKETAEATHPKKVKEEVEQAFNEWKDAYAEGDKNQFLKGFAQIPELVVRISQSEIIGYDNYLQAFQGREIPKTTQSFRNVTTYPIDENAAFVTYLRSTGRSGENGKPLAYRGTVIFARTYSGWKVIAWHAHVVEDIPPPSARD
ncbi:MAG TPA: nuclear transport factor 2 family protein [Acidobacteriota bacterium]